MCSELRNELGNSVMQINKLGRSFMNVFFVSNDATADFVV